MFAILSLYKEKGESSFAALTRVKKYFNTGKVGHAGTLDPLAEGVLAVAVGEATKLLPYFKVDPKVYKVEICFGFETATLDAEGIDLDLVKKNASALDFNFSKQDFEGVLNDFVGEIDQVPPLYSAVKIDGKRAYDLARNAESNEEFLESESKLKSRKVSMFSAKILKFELPLVELEIECSTGFYVRSLVRDLAFKLNQKAFMSNLVRSQVGAFISMKSLDLKDLFLPVDQVLINFEKYEMTEAEFLDLRNGKVITASVSEFKNPVVYGYFNDNLVSILSVDSKNNLKALKNLNI
jgi:tRNA pseudouridine55 synthase